VTDRQTDRQTDGQTEFSSLDRVCITCSAVKMDSEKKHCEGQGISAVAGDLDHSEVSDRPMQRYRTAMVGRSEAYNLVDSNGSRPGTAYLLDLTIEQ